LRLTSKTATLRTQALLASCCALAAGSAARGANSPAPSAFDLSIEELGQIQVTTASRRPESLEVTPAAVYVITAEEIRRSGVTTIPDALRLAPNVEVARNNSHQWTISIRGFSNDLSNKLLVLIDGRSVYSPLYAGVFWDVQDVLLADVERIEVVAGPGGAVWGANAVNGVINIITKKAKDTQGLLVSGGYGNEERGFGAGRYGFAVNDNIHVRAYVKGFNRDAFWDGQRNEQGADEWNQVRSGFRADLDAGKSHATVQGDIYGGESGANVHAITNLAPVTLREFDQDASVKGGNVITRFNHEFSETSSAQLQLYYDRTNRDDYFTPEIRDTFDVDFQHDWTISDWYRLLWGTDYRYSKGRTSSSFASSLVDPDRVSQFVAGFLNNEFTITDGLKLYLGSMAEYNSYTGFELQPSGRFAWTPNEHHTVWGAVSRAVRTPSQADDDVRVFVGTVVTQPVTLPPPYPPLTVNVQAVPEAVGQRNFKSENEAAYELGYRFFPTPTLSFDLTAYYNTYDDLRSTEPGSPTAQTIQNAIATFFSTGIVPGIPTPLYLENRIDGHTYGTELAAAWQVTKPWKLGLTYTFFRMHLENDKDSADPASVQVIEKSSPTNMIGLTSYLDLPYHLELDHSLKYTDNLRVPNAHVPSYFRLDTRLAWHPTETLELALVGLNLLDHRHEEWGSSYLYATSRVQRSYYAQATWRW
jgi:iron complex outermembrane receptor protein